MNIKDRNRKISWAKLIYILRIIKLNLRLNTRMLWIKDQKSD